MAAGLSHVRYLFLVHSPVTTPSQRDRQKDTETETKTDKDTNTQIHIHTHAHINTHTHTHTHTHTQRQIELLVLEVSQLGLACGGWVIHICIKSRNAEPVVWVN